MRAAEEMGARSYLSAYPCMAIWFSEGSGIASDYNAANLQCRFGSSAHGGEVMAKTKKPLANSERQTLRELLALKSPPYAASWLDRLNAWVEGLPFPAIVFYIALYVLFSVAPAFVRWSFGLGPFGEFGGEFVYQLFTLEAFYFSYLSYGIARTALRRFKPLLDISELQYRHLEYEFIFLPAKIMNIITAAVILSSFYLGSTLVGIRQGGTISLGYQIAGFLGWVAGMMSAIAFVYRMLHQMRWVNRAYAMIKKLDLFNLGPIYALSTFTATMSLIFLVILYSNLLQDPLYFTVGFYFWGSVVVSAVALAGFVLPLLGINHRLVDAKAALMRESGEEVSSAFQRLAGQQKSKKLENIVNTRQLVDAVVRKREYIQNIPTWPWQPATLRSMGLGVGLPVLIWLVQQGLGRLLK